MRTRDDLRSGLGKRQAIDDAAMGVGILALQLDDCCEHPVKSGTWVMRLSTYINQISPSAEGYETMVAAMCASVCSVALGRAWRVEAVANGKEEACEGA